MSRLNPFTALHGRTDTKQERQKKMTNREDLIRSLGEVLNNLILMEAELKELTGTVIEQKDAIFDVMEELESEEDDGK